MAGKRHHVLPRFLLKGFASRTESADSFVYLYRKESGPFETNTKNVSVVTHFYGKEGEVNADDGITEAEGDFASLINTLRECNDGESIDSDSIVEFVVHLSGRTKHLRDSLIESTGSMMGKFTDVLSDEKQLREWTVGSFEKNPDDSMRVLNEEIDKLAIDPLLKAVAKTIMPELIPQVLSSLEEGDLHEFADMFKQFGIDVTEQLPKMVKDSHNQVLEKGLVAAPRSDEYRQLKWLVRKTKTSLILADVGCLFEVNDKRRFVSMAGNDDQIVNVYLPISSDVLVVGTNDPNAPLIAISELNSAFASASRDYFVSAEDSPDRKQLQALLGSDAEIISDEDLEEIVRDAFQGE